MPIKSSKDKAAFINEIKLIKKQHGSVGKFISEPTNVHNFLNNQPIRSYLTRNADEISFQDSHPAFDCSANGKNNNDFYELKVYKKSPFFAKYFRFFADTPSFYVQGASESTQRILNDSIDVLNDKYIPSGIYTLPIQDIYQIRHCLNAISYSSYSSMLASYLPKSFKDKAPVKFVLSPNWKDTHATLLVTILDPVKKNPLVTLFLNSMQKVKYTNEINDKFNNRRYYNYCLNNEERKEVVQQINAINKDDAKDPFLYIDKEKRIAYSFNETDELYASNYDTQESIDLLFSLDQKEMLGSKLFVLRSIPFIDASHHIQTHEDDQNCSLYGFNFLNAIVDMLSDPQQADRIYALAEKINLEDENAELELKNIFKEELKKYLPCYYNKDLALHSADTIKEHHLKQRWNLESLGIANKSSISEFDEKNNKTCGP